VNSSQTREKLYICIKAHQGMELSAYVWLLGSISPMALLLTSSTTKKRQSSIFLSTYCLPFG